MADAQAELQDVEAALEALLAGVSPLAGEQLPVVLHTGGAAQLPSLEVCGQALQQVVDGAPGAGQQLHRPLHVAGVQHASHLGGSDAVYHRELNNGGLPWENGEIWREQSPHTYAGNFKTPMMLTIGEKDYRVPLNQTLAAWTYLQRQGVPSKLLVYHQANHWIMAGPDAKHFWEEVHGWLEKYLKAPKQGSEPISEIVHPCS